MLIVPYEGETWKNVASWSPEPRPRSPCSLWNPRTPQCPAAVLEHRHHPTQAKQTISSYGSLMNTEAQVFNRIRGCFNLLLIIIQSTTTDKHLTIAAAAATTRTRTIRRRTRPTTAANSTSGAWKLACSGPPTWWDVNSLALSFLFEVQVNPSEGTHALQLLERSAWNKSLSS